MFDPALKEGKPVPHLINFEQFFSPSELPDESGDYLLRLEKKHPERIVAAHALDAPLKPVSQRAPVFPVSVGPGVTTGEAMIEVLIDEDGHARLPRIVSATDEAFGLCRDAGRGGVVVRAAHGRRQTRGGAGATAVQVRSEVTRAGKGWRQVILV